MAEATWGDDTRTPAVDWRMSAALENMPRGDDELAEVTDLEGAERAWYELGPEHRAAALLTPERSVQIDGTAHLAFTFEAITLLADRLPGASDAGANPRVRRGLLDRASGWSERLVRALMGP